LSIYKYSISLRLQILNNNQMRKALFSVLFLSICTLSAYSQIDKIVGKWKTIDDKDGSTKSIVYIFKATNGMYYGKVEKLFKEPTKTCTECDDANKDKPILGMMVVNKMQYMFL